LEVGGGNAERVGQGMDAGTVEVAGTADCDSVVQLDGMEFFDKDGN